LRLKQKKDSRETEKKLLPSLFLPEKKDISGLSEGPAALVRLI